MRRLLPFFACVALAGCGLTASVTEEETQAPEQQIIYPAGFEGQGSMLLCRKNSTDECTRTQVVTDGKTVLRMIDGSGVWIDMEESECRDGHCYAKDVNGVEWKLEP